jgi:hypothetical protein
MGLFLATVQRARRHAYSAKVLSTMEMQNAWEQSFGSSSAITVIRRLGVEQMYWSLIDSERWADVSAVAAATHLFAMLVMEAEKQAAAAEEARKRNTRAQLAELGPDGKETGYRVSLSLTTLCRAFGDKIAGDMIKRKFHVWVDHAAFRHAIDMAMSIETPEVEFCPPYSYKNCLRKA